MYDGQDTVQNSIGTVFYSKCTFHVDCVPEDATIFVVVAMKSPVYVLVTQLLAIGATV